MKKIFNALKTIICFVIAVLFALSGVGNGNKVVTASTAMAIQRAKPTATSIAPSGYVGLKVLENIENWQLNAYKNNPSIVGSILASKTGEVTLGDIKAGSIDDYYDMYIGETPDGRALFYRHKDAGGGTNDIDFRFVKDGTAITDWSGAKELWVFADYSSYGADEPKLRISFEETDKTTGARKSWRAVSGASYIWDGTASRVNTTVWDNRVVLPKGFKGWVCWTLDKSNLQKYWSSGRCSDDLDLVHVQQFQMAAYGDNKSVGTEYYIDKFTIVGDVDGQALPVSVNGTEGFTCKEVWSFDNIGFESYDGSIMAWSGEFAGKLLTGLALNYLVSPSTELFEAGKKLADDLVNAQWEDGYLGIYTGGARYAAADSNWDVWNNYHCIYGLYRWYKAVGDEKYLSAACKALDCAMNFFGPDGKYYSSFGYEENMAISHAFICLYSETGNLRYLQTAEYIVTDNWADKGNWLISSEAGKEFYQSELPRWESLHTITTLGGLYEATGKMRYYTAFEQIWESILKTDVHNDGGFSSGEGACGTPYSTGSIESCCTVAWMAMSAEFLQISKRLDVADELERSYYNAMLGSLMDDHVHITYDTPMNGVRVPARETLAFQYYGGSPDFSCCQANLARGLGEIADWAVLTDDKSVYLNYYGSCNVIAKTPSGKRISFAEQTVYPSDGDVKITVSLSAAESFELALRVPKWSASTTIKVNDKVIDNVKAGTYCTIDRTWTDGDVIDLSFDMSLHYWKGEENFNGYSSVFYGPVLLTLDSAYNNLSGVLTGFYADDLENARVIKESGGVISVLTRTTDGDPVMLVDFASAGRSRREYVSWLKVDFGGAEPLSDGRVWQARRTHNVFVNDKYVITTNTRNLSAGDTVRFTVRGGKTPIVTSSFGSVRLKNVGGGTYSFVMPGGEVYVDVEK